MSATKSGFDQAPCLAAKMQMKVGGGVAHRDFFNLEEFLFSHQLAQLRKSVAAQLERGLFLFI